MFPSTGSGTSLEVTSWMCAAPTLSYSVKPSWSGVPISVKDLMTSQQILTNAEQGPLVETKDNTGQYVASNTVDQAVVADPSKCQPVSSLPTDFAGTASVQSDQYEPSSSPVTEAHFIQGANNAYVGRGGFAFGAMDSSEADFYGLLPAGLQNAAGGFTTPSQASILAALTDATTNPDGTLSPNYTDTADAGRYPLPMITYALVSTAPQPTSDQALQLRNLLTNLVDYSASGGAGTTQPLPAGYVPLPENLKAQALADISKDIVDPSGTPQPPPPTTPPPTTTTGGGHPGALLSPGRPRAAAPPPGAPRRRAPHPPARGRRCRRPSRWSWWPDLPSR